MFDPEKTYKTKKRGYAFRFYADDGAGDHPIHGAFYDPKFGWIIESWTRDLRRKDAYGCDSLDLIEVTPYDDFKVDEPVMVRNGRDKWLRRYFAGVSSNNKPMVWANGATSWSAAHECASALICYECRRPTEEELSND